MSHEACKQEANDLRSILDMKDEEIKALKEKVELRESQLKEYQEPFEMRPTYQVLEQKLEKLEKILDIDTVGWATPKDLIDTIRREVIDK